MHLSYRRIGDRGHLPASTLAAKVQLGTSRLTYLGVEKGRNSMKVEERSGYNMGFGGASVGFFSCLLGRMWTSSVMLPVRASILLLNLRILVSNRALSWFAKLFAAAWL